MEETLENALLWQLSKRPQSTSVGEDVEKREHCVLLVGYRLVQTPWKSVEVPPKITHRMAIQSSSFQRKQKH